MRVLIIGLALLQFVYMAAATCVLESEFGFILNCNFKKSGLFRVRNLGGLKAHFGLGFSLGDELGFGESLGNLEGNRRRALNYKTGFIDKVGVVSPKLNSSAIAPSQGNRVRSINKNSSAMTEVMFLPLGVPTFRPIPKVDSNLIRRSDVILPERMNNNEMTNVYFLPENMGQANVTNFTNLININISDKQQNMYNGLTNVTSSLQKKMNNMYSNENYNKNRMQTAEEEEFGTEKLSTKLQSPKFNTVQSSKVMVVMNAPKEYYPSGYDKNFDDNFKSKVDLPPTDFTCTKQKYFPGLYANIDLGCMVFHVCAVTNNGILMKSFLCPESTLFDQSILKCNWWFYVDCNNSTYDSNIPISKSYQLMKSLSYFSNYTKSQIVENKLSQKNVIIKE